MSPLSLGYIGYNTRAVYVVYVYYGKQDCNATLYCVLCAWGVRSFARCYSGFTYGYRVGAVCVY